MTSIVEQIDTLVQTRQVEVGAILESIPQALVSSGVEAALAVTRYADRLSQDSLVLLTAADTLDAVLTYVNTMGPEFAEEAKNIRTLVNAEVEPY